jgi:ABC-2 type transport system permease protein
MNIYLHELKSYFKSSLGWLIAILSVVFIYALFYPTFSKDMDGFSKLISSLPEPVVNAFGFHSNTIGSILGYYTFMMTFVLILGSIQTMILGLSILSKEIREKTADFLLSKPVSRSKVINSKLLASLTILFVSNVIYFITFYLILLSFADNQFAFKTYTLLTLIIIIIQLIFFALGMFLSVIIPKIKSVLPISMGIVFGFYLLGTFIGDKMRVLLPFQYFKPADVLLKGNYESKYLIISMLVITISLILTYIIYKKKDIHAV